MEKFRLKILDERGMITKYMTEYVARPGQTLKTQQRSHMGFKEDRIKTKRDSNTHSCDH